MSIAVSEIERIVREVLAGLVAAQEPKSQGSSQKTEATASNANAGSQKPQKNGQTAVEKRESLPGDLIVKSRVVTMNDVLGRLETTRRLVVSREAIVTPAVRDELLRRGIALEVCDTSNARAVAVRLVLQTARTEFDSTSLAAALQREGFRVDQASSDCLIAATEQLAAEILQPDTLGVLLTRHAAAGLCLANRLRGVRAVSAVDAPGAASASAAIGANLLVANPRQGTFFQLKQIITEFGRGGVRSCPAVFREKLG